MYSRIGVAELCHKLPSVFDIHEGRKVDVFGNNPPHWDDSLATPESCNPELRIRIWVISPAHLGHTTVIPAV